MILPVRLYSDPILNTTCKSVIDFQDESLEQLIQDLMETMVAYNGVGIASNQVGVDKAVCVLDLENRTKKMSLINPTIITYSKETDVKQEGCLSCPGLTVHMKRPLGVIVDSHLLNGELIRYQFDGYDARVFFHEWDHLQGKHIGSSVKSLKGMI
jgi:peptide deformylase